jgi:hypothetical protein
MQHLGRLTNVAPVKAIGHGAVDTLPAARGVA